MEGRKNRLIWVFVAIIATTCISPWVMGIDPRPPQFVQRPAGMPLMQADEDTRKAESLIRQMKSLERDVRGAINRQNDWITDIGTLQRQAEVDRYRLEKVVEDIGNRVESLEKTVAKKQ